MAQGATLYNFDIELADTDRGVYESLALRVARHPSESEEYLVSRVLAYLLEHAEGIEFSRGVSSPDEPAIVIRDRTGVMTTWIDIGMPDAARLHKASKAARRVPFIRTGTRRNFCNSWPASGFTTPGRWSCTRSIAASLARSSRVSSGGWRSASR